MLYWLNWVVRAVPKSKCTVPPPPTPSLEVPLIFVRDALDQDLQIYLPREIDVAHGAWLLRMEMAYGFPGAIWMSPGLKNIVIYLVATLNYS